MHNEITVVYCFDKNYVDPTAVSAYSVFVSTKSKVKFYWICSGYAVLHAEFYKKSLSAIGMDITIIEVPETAFLGWKQDLIVPHLTSAAYFRLLIPSLINHHRVIYLDSDTLVRADISELYMIDLNNAPIAGVFNFFSPSEEHIKPPILDPAIPYINSGVMLMDLDKLRADDFIRKVEKIHTVHHNKIMAGDQCVINKYLEANKMLLTRNWNYMVKGGEFSESEFADILADKNIRLLHFTDCSKPWNVIGRNKAMSDYWWHIADNMRKDLKNAGASNY